MAKRGKLELFTGPMFGGKTSRLFYEIEKTRKFAGSRTILFKPTADERMQELSVTFNNETMGAVGIPKDAPWRIFQVLKELKPKGEEFEIVALDEVQFYDMHLHGVVDELLDMGYNVLAAGLETDFRNEPFGPTLSLISLVKHQSYWHRILPFCNECQRKGQRPGKVAFFTQRIVNGEPAKYNDPIIVSGGAKMYEARCYECYVPPPGKPIMREKHRCICPRECDCQDPDRGYISEECSFHNLNPSPHPECGADEHWDGRWGRRELVTA